MPTVVAVKLRYNPKEFWFDPAGHAINTGDHVLVDTERGQEIALIANAAVEVTEAQIKALSTPLKKVVRVITESDYDDIDRLDAKGHAVMPRFRELIDKYELDIKAVDVAYTFTGERATFYFSSDVRVDFRELVRELASELHIRIDMRQIGVRDEARAVGGLAHCGEELCCARMGGNFEPVSIRMAKEQDLPLNPVKISGACGRLMCCLRYEFEAYKDFKSRAPKKGAIIDTPLGLAKVIEFNTPREIVHMRLEDGKHMEIPLADFDCAKNADGSCARPCKVGREAIERCTASNIQLALAALDREFLADEVQSPSAVQPRRRRERDKKAGSRAGDAGAGGADGSGGSGGSGSSSVGKPRPGQRSSGVRNPQGATQNVSQGNPQGGAQDKKRSNRNRRRKPASSGANSASGASRTGSSGSVGGTGNANSVGNANSSRKPRRRHTASGGSTGNLGNPGGQSAQDK
jgi:cell fate regulator YaaT (PSP1 superfamily)